MTPAGWIFMIVSWTVILGLFTFCLSRTLRPSKSEPGKNDAEQQPES